MANVWYSIIANISSFQKIIEASNNFCLKRNKQDK